MYKKDKLASQRKIKLTLGTISRRHSNYSPSCATQSSIGHTISNASVATLSPISNHEPKSSSSPSSTPENFPTAATSPSGSVFSIPTILWTTSRTHNHSTTLHPSASQKSCACSSRGRKTSMSMPWEDDPIRLRFT